MRKGLQNQSDRGYTQEIKYQRLYNDNKEE